MKRLLVIFFSLLLAGSMYAQRPYQSMVVEGATWVYVGFFESAYCSNGIRPIPDKFYTIEWFEGDTIINDKTYKKRHKGAVEPINANWDQYTITSIDEQGTTFWREDSINRKVYMYNSSLDIEWIAYNFSPLIGDTVFYPLSPGTQYFVIDTMLVLDKIESQWLFSYHPKQTDAIISIPDSIRIWASYQGILDSDRVCVSEVLIEKIGINEYIGFYSSNLILYCQSRSECSNMIISNNDEGFESGIRMYPNPVYRGSSIRIQLEQEHQLAKLCLVSIDGAFTHEYKGTESDIKLPSSLPAGIYNLIITMENGSRVVKRVCVF